MNRLFDKKSKKSPKPSAKNALVKVSTKIATRPLGFGEDLAIGPESE
jgi:hypothetical protein